MRFWLAKRGTRRSQVYLESRAVATVQGSGFDGWRYAIGPFPWSERKYATARMAKTMCENALRQKDQSNN